MNIAVIIGVSVYSNSNNNLPGCKNDADAINQILKKTDKYDEILYINNNESSAKTKELLSNFILNNKGTVINELFFYYSGHGEFSNEEFYYVLSDFDAKKKNQTSLQNTEIDDLVRTLSPDLVIKVIDACQSGTTYIKEGNVLNKYFNDSKKGFNNCYFLNSSLNNQSSFQNGKLSFFTYSFIKALKEHKTKEIRYKDIIDVISDEFSDNQDQTPFFVIQADLTEKFCSFSTELREYLNSFNASTVSDTESKDAPLKLADLVKLDAKEYVNKEGALQAVEFIRKEFERISLSIDYAELYKLEINFLQEYKTIPNTRVIGNWLKDNKNDFFAKLVYETRVDYETGEEYTTLSGFDLKFELPFKAISIEVNSLYPNLASYQCNTVFLISKKHIRFFYFVTNYIDESWENKNLNTKEIKWIFNEVKIADESAIRSAIELIKTNIETRIQNDLNAKFEVEPKVEDKVDDLPF
ncbi:caspase family protein [Limnovirga soli]|uniref:Peptidase C14 caspase domain-containing protein n=1 Tax=Limnovirga soli TaxID=2656915 RepID=A0A8J8JYX5_9BACT|nr:caspase family protein [Limnovirga soli]NNV57756.1 hypothetical protein [Limnovirga soli]